MNPGLLRERIEIYMSVSAADAQTGANEREWSLLSQLSARVMSDDGQRQAVGDEIAAAGSMTFETHMRRYIKAGMRLKWRGNLYDIEHATHERGKFHTLIKCTLVNE